MKAISLWQPWASLWVSGRKIHETRHWPTDYRGPLGVHAAKRPIDDLAGDELDTLCTAIFGADYRRTLPRGAIVGIVDLMDCIATDSLLRPVIERVDYLCGDFEPGRFMWRAANPRPCVPVPWKGRQGFFNVPLVAL